MRDLYKRYAENRAKAIKRYKELLPRIRSPWWTVEDVNEAFKLKQLYNL